MQQLSTTTSVSALRKPHSSSSHSSFTSSTSSSSSSTIPQDKTKPTNATTKTKKQLKEEKKQKKEKDLHDLVNGNEHWDEYQPTAPHRKVIGTLFNFIFKKKQLMIHFIMTGYVTSGNYSHVRSSGSGIGFCTAQVIPSILNNAKR